MGSVGHSKLQENSEKKKKHPCCTNCCAFRCVIKGFRPEDLKLLFECEITFFSKLHYFRGKPVLTMFYILSTALHYSLYQVHVSCKAKIILSNYYQWVSGAFFRTQVSKTGLKPTHRFDQKHHSLGPVEHRTAPSLQCFYVISVIL